MSGPKHGQAQLNREREAQLQRQREEELRRRRDEEARRREQERLRAIAAARDEAARALAQAAGARDGAQQVDAPKWAPTELKTAADLFARAQQSFSSGDSVPSFGQVTQLAAQSEQGFMKAQQTALARAEEDRIRREMERKKAAAAAALARAKRQAEYVSRLPHQKFAPTELEKAQKGMGNIDRLLAGGDFDRATTAAEEAEKALTLLEQKVRRLHQAWVERRRAAEEALAASREQLAGMDTTFVDTWSKGTRQPVEAELKRLEAAFAREDFGAVSDGAPALGRQIQAAIDLANDRHGQEQRRLVIVNAMMQALHKMQYRVGAQLADPNDPTGLVIISAGDSSGRNVEVKVNLAADQIDLNLDDDEVTGSRTKANCVHGVEDLIALLTTEGVEMEITDWGRVDPKRKPKAAQANQLPKQDQKENRK